MGLLAALSVRLTRAQLAFEMSGEITHGLGPLEDKALLSFAEHELLGNQTAATERISRQGECQTG